MGPGNVGLYIAHVFSRCSCYLLRTFGGPSMHGLVSADGLTLSWKQQKEETVPNYLLIKYIILEVGKYVRLQ